MIEDVIISEDGLDETGELHERDGQHGECDSQAMERVEFYRSS